MPEIPVNDKGAVLYYEDTGAPDGSSDYLTIVLAHGLTFYGAVFRRLLPYATSYNMRFVCVNMRDYLGSTSYTPEELQAYADADLSVQAAAMKAHGEEMATFLECFIKKYNIPKIQVIDGKKTKGLALLTWSMSNILAFSFLGNVTLFPKETVDFLAQYLHTVVLYDPSNSSLGLPPAEGVYHPLRDTTMSLKERGDYFTHWVSCYFENIPDLATVSPSLLASRQIVQEGPLAYSTPGPAKVPTVDRISPEELESMIDRDVLERSSMIMLRVSREVFHSNFRHALVDTRGAWLGVKVLLLWCDESMHDCVWAAKIITETVERPSAEGSVRRNFEAQKLSGANHFPHWDMPEAFVRLLATKV